MIRSFDDDDVINIFIIKCKEEKKRSGGIRLLHPRKGGRSILAGIQAGPKGGLPDSFPDLHGSKSFKVTIPMSSMY